MGAQFSVYLGRVVGEKLVRCTCRVACCDGCGVCSECCDRGTAIEAGPVSASLQGDSIRILTFNTAQLLARAHWHVANRIAKYIGQTIRPDIVCLQEVFDEGARYVLSRVLGSFGYHHRVVKCGYDKCLGLGEDSGLFLASKFPILSYQFRSYKVSRSCTADVLANKGYLTALIDCGPTLMWVTSTHVQADQGGTSGRAERIVQMAQFMSELNNPNKNRVVHDLMTKYSQRPFVGIFVGDWNVEAETDEYSSIVTLLRSQFPTANDCFRYLHPNAKRFPGHTLDPLNNTNPYLDTNGTVPSASRIDYVFQLSSSDPSISMRCTNCEVDRMQDLSDHYGLYADFKVLGPPPGQTEVQPPLPAGYRVSMDKIASDAILKTYEAGETKSSRRKLRKKKHHKSQVDQTSDNSSTRSENTIELSAREDKSDSLFDTNHRPRTQSDSDLQESISSLAPTMGNRSSTVAGHEDHEQLSSARNSAPNEMIQSDAGSDHSKEQQTE